MVLILELILRVVQRDCDGFELARSDDARRLLKMIIAASLQPLLDFQRVGDRDNTRGLYLGLSQAGLGQRRPCFRSKHVSR